jgi:hypothetical protein
LVFVIAVCLFFVGCGWHQTLQSFFRNLHLTHVKITSTKIKKNLQKYLNAYKKGKSIKALSKQANYPPYLMSRYLLDSIAEIRGGKKGITAAMRNPLEELGDIGIIRPDYRASEEVVNQDDDSPM